MKNFRHVNNRCWLVYASSIGKHQVKKRTCLRRKFCFHLLQNMAQNNKTKLKQSILRAEVIALSFEFAVLVSDVFLWLFFCMVLVWKSMHFLSLAAILSKLASLAGNLADQFPVEGLSLFCDLLCLWIFRFECAFFAVSGSLTTSGLAITQFVSVETIPFKASCGFIWCILLRCLVTIFVFHRQPLIKWLQHWQLCEMNHNCRGWTNALICSGLVSTLFLFIRSCCI